VSEDIYPSFYIVPGSRLLIEKMEGNFTSRYEKFSIRKVDIVFASLYFVVQIVGLTGNALVITVVRRTRSMHTTTNFLLVNLAVADILTLFTCPRNGYVLIITLYHPGGLAGDFLCKFLTGNALVGITMSVSSMTLTVLAVERYRALLRPMNRRLVVSRENVLVVIAATWIVSLLSNIPDFIENRYSEHLLKCVCPFSLELVKDSTVHVICTVVFLGLFPFLILSYCYAQILRGLFFTKKICSETSNAKDLESKKKLARLLIIVTTAFYICYIPYGGYFIYLLLQDQEYLNGHYRIHSIILKIVELLLVCSCCLNPILYGFQSSNYRKGFKNVVCCKKLYDETRSAVVRLSTRKERSKESH
jgi:hypothetical protein